MDEPLFVPDEYPSNYAERANALWASIAAANPARLGGVVSLGWGSAQFQDYELRLSVSPPPQFVLTAQVIPLKPADPIRLTGHSYSWRIGPWSELAEKRAALGREVRTLAADLTQRYKDQKPDPVSNATPVTISGNTSGAPGFVVKNFRGVDLTVTLKDESDELTISPPVYIGQGRYSAISAFTDDGFVFLRPTNEMDDEAHVQRTALMDGLVLTAVNLKKQ